MRHKPIYSLIALLALVAASWAQTSTSSAPLPRLPAHFGAAPRVSPLQFLEALKANDSPSGVFTFEKPVSGWITAEHIPALLALLYSTEECTPVVDAHSSFIPPRSTVGDEAAFMIVGYRAGFYPARLHAGKITAQDKMGLRAWWSSRQAGN